MSFSVNTNAGAFAALQNLGTSDKLLAMTQSRMNTGLKVASAKDSAAIYAIAQNMRANLAGLNAVQSSLDRAQSEVDIALAASEAISDLLVVLKEKAVGASDAGLDTASRIALNEDFTELKEQIASISQNATFNGVNVIDGSSGISTIISSDGGDTMSMTLSAAPLTLTGLQLDTIDLVGDSSLVVTPTRLTDDTNFSSNSGLAETDSSAGYYALLNFIDDSANQSALDSAISSASGGSLGFSDIEANLDRSTGLLSNGDIAGGIASALNNAYSDTHFAYETAGDPSKYVVDVIEGDPNYDVYVADAGVNSVFTSGPGDVTILVSGDPSLPDTAQLAVSAIEAAISTVNSAMSELGAMSRRLELQSAFTGSLASGIEVGIGNLVDADMAHESANLTAYQTKQQLGLQALSIANQTPSAVLSLFR